MSEYKVHHLVGELIQQLVSAATPETVVENLQKPTSSSTTSNAYVVAAQNSVKQLAEKSPVPEEFLAKYEELKSKNVEMLGSYVQLLSHISEDKKLREYLDRNAKKAAQLTPSLGNLSIESVGSVDNAKPVQVTTANLSEIRIRLQKEIAMAQTSKKAPMMFKKPTEVLNKARHPNFHEPSWPDWDKTNPHLKLDFTLDSNSAPPFAGSIPKNSQEHFLLEELMYVFLGIEGEYIVPDEKLGPYEPRTFSISPAIDGSLQDLTRQILPLASHYSMLAAFVEQLGQFESGQVNHALSAAISRFLQDYHVMVSQFQMNHRRGELTLQKLWFYVQSSLETMGILNHIATTVGKAGARGGKVLTLLHEITKKYVGISKSQDVCFLLTQDASVPYLEVLEKWVYKGVISDPYQEFMVEDNEVIGKEELPLDYSADYWEKRYTIRRERIPVFLEPLADVILRTGKYINVIRQCGKNISHPKAEPIRYAFKDHRYVTAIQEAYSFASNDLLQLLMVENDLLGRLRSVKHYFLLDQGDFIVQFMDSCEEELGKNIDDIVPTRLESLLELTLRTSAANLDPYKDDLRSELLPYDLMFQMFKILSIETQEEKEYRLPSDKPHLLGLESFSFGYDVKWPVSLVLNRKAIACYQMIFRHLFYCKHVERLLCRAWICNKVAKSFPRSDSSSYTAAFALRQRMLNCIQNLEYFMMIEVIEPNWVAFLANLKKASDVDEVLVCHWDFLDTCLKDCMLTNPTLLRTVNKLMAISVQFCHFIQLMRRYYVDAELTSMLGPDDEGPDLYAESEAINDMKQSDSFEQSIRKLDLQFTALLVGLLEKITDQGRERNSDKLVNILYRLDFNNFYSGQMQKMYQEGSEEQEGTSG